MVVSRTPLRISFLGGGTDLPTWTAANEGACLSVTIDKYVWISLRSRPPFGKHTDHLIHLRDENPARRIIVAALTAHGGDGFVEMTHQGDLPARSGMGSSSAFTVGFLHALSALRGEIISKAELAARAVHLEQNVLKETVGAQDQYAAAHGGMNLYRFRGAHVSVQPLPSPEPTMRALNDRLMLFHVGPRPDGVTGSTVSAKYAPKDHHLRTLTAMVDSGLKMLAGGALDDLGLLLGDAWALKRELGGISDDRIDAAYKTALGAGALGGKLLGAGGGGFLLLFARPGDHDVIKARLGLLHVPFRFESDGSRILFYSP